MPKPIKKQALFSDIDEVLKFVDTFDKPLPVFLTHFESKLPIGKWKQVIDGERFTEEELREKHDKARGYVNVSISTGKHCPRGLVVLDLDNQAALDYARANFPEPTLITVTRAGEHWFYARDPSLPDLGNRADLFGSNKKFEHDAIEAGFDVKVARGLKGKELEAEKLRAADARAEAAKVIEKGPVMDIRGSGGQVVAGGSTHPSGFVYAMKQPWTQELLDLTPELPEEAIDRISKFKPPVKKRVYAPSPKDMNFDLVPMDVRIGIGMSLVDKLDPSEAGAGGHDRLWFAVQRLINGCLINPDGALNVIRECFNPRCTPPWDNEDIAHKIDDAMKTRGKKNTDGEFLVHHLENMRIEELSEIKQQPIVVDDSGDVDDLEFDDGEDGDFGDDEEDLEFSDAPVTAIKKLGNPTAVVPAQSNKPIKQAGLVSEQDKQLTKAWRGPGVDYMTDVKSNPDSEAMFDLKNGNYSVKGGFNNYCIAVQHSSVFEFTVRKNEIKGDLELWKDGEFDRVVKNKDIVYFREKLGRIFNSLPSAKEVFEVLEAVGEKDVYNPVVKYFNEVAGTWDGVDRFDSLVTKGLSASGTPLHRTMIQNMCVSAVARAMEPGCQVDVMIILVGNQGVLKSTFVIELFGDIDHKGRGDLTNSMSLTKLDDKDTMAKMSAFFAIELSEVNGILKSKKQSAALKAFVTVRSDNYRAPYAHISETHGRRSIFIGTTNEKEILTDITGSRRFHIIEVGNIDDMWIALNRRQIWAQAHDIWSKAQTAKSELADMKCGVTPFDASRKEELLKGLEENQWWLTKDMEDARIKDAESFHEDIPYEDAITTWVNNMIASGHQYFGINDCIKGVLEVDTKDTKQYHSDFKNTLSKLGINKEDEKKRRKTAKGETNTRHYKIEDEI